ncbi:hypothetical protein XAC71A_320001 [Xanthomonas citri pv. citri]|nr:hypothetical protein XAC71A_320001 [Xanthomonas citri pv. citri]
MDTSESAIFHGLEMSRKSWAYQPHAHVQARKAHCRRVAAAAVAGLHRLRQIHEVHRR